MDWISAGEFSESGIGNDGTITLIVAIATAAAALFLRDRARMISVLVGGAIIVLVAIVDIADVNDVSDQLGGIVDVSVGIGLWLTLIGGFAALVGAFLKD